MWKQLTAIELLKNRDITHFLDKTENYLGQILHFFIYVFEIINLSNQQVKIISSPTKYVLSSLLDSFFQHICEAAIHFKTKFASPNVFNNNKLRK